MAKKFSIKKLAAGVLAALMVVTALPVSGLTASVSKAADDTVSVYRSYNPNSGEHFMTITKAEHDSVVAAGRSDEGVAWTAPASSKTPVYRSYNPNSGEHLLVPQEEAEWLVTQGWNNEGIKMYSDDGEGVAIYRVYNPNAKDAGAHLYTANKAEADYLVGLGWTYDNNGKPLLYGVSTSEDKKGEITLSDINGLQSDGTGLVSDVLNVSYGSDLGAPQTITWYYNNTVVKAYTNQQGDLTNGLYLATAGATDADDNVVGLDSCKDGEYYVVIVNTKGETFKSNTIELVYDEIPAEVTNFEITDDYEKAANIVAANKDTKAVLSVTLNKDYAGKFYIYEDSVEKYTSTASVVVDNDNGDYFDSVTTASKLTESAAIDKGTSKGIKYTYENGKTTYMFQVPTAGELYRGKSYKLAFDQKNIATDNIGTTGRTDIETTDSYLCDYLAGPKAISVVTAAAGVPAIVALIGEDGVLSYLGNDDTVADSGFNSIIIYANDSAKTEDATVEVQSGGKVKEGIYTSTGTVTSGSGKYYFAVAKTAPGVFGEKSETLTSGFKAGNVSIAGSVTVSEDSSVNSQANVDLAGVAASATVYVVCAEDNATASFTPSAANSFGLDTDLVSTYRGKAHVEAGQGDAEISNVFKSSDIDKNFVAILVPDDESTYVRIGGGKNASTPYTLEETPTTVQVSDEGIKATEGNNKITIIGLDAYNQFGDLMTSAVATSSVGKTASVTAIDSTATNHEVGEAAWYVTAGAGKLTLVVTDKLTGIDKNDGFSVSLLGSTIKITNVHESATAFGTANNGYAKVVIDGTTYASGDNSTGAVIVPTTATYAPENATGFTAAAKQVGKLTVEDQFGEAFTLTAINNGESVSAAEATTSVETGSTATEKAGIGVAADGKVYVIGSATMATVAGTYKFTITQTVGTQTITLGTLTVTFDGNASASSSWTSAL